MSETQTRIQELLVEKFGASEDETTPEATLEALRFDSLAILELVLTFEEEFGVVVADDEITPSFTVGDTATLVSERLVGAAS